MRNRRTPLRSASPLLLLLAAAACSSAGGTDVAGHEYDPSKSSHEPIIGGVKASAYPESALIDMYSGGQLDAACSGSVIAPRVVLTAGHCILGQDGWKVTTPFAGKQTQYATKSDTKYQGSGGSVDPSSQDLGLIFLDNPINLPSYPKIQATKLPDGTKVVNIGRIDNGQFSSDYLSVGPAVPVTDGANSGYQYDYSTQEIIQSGDSGGPVMLTGAAPHTIVAVNSGAGGGEEVLARTDAVYAWIQQAIADHGGGGDPGGTGGSGGGGGAGGSGAGGSGGDPAGGGGAGGDPQGGAGGSSPPPDPVGTGGTCNGGNGTCQGPSEAEPNDSVGHAQSIDSAICGSLDTADDQDWYTWSVGGAGVKYALEVAGDSAEILVWKRVNGTYYKIPNASPKQVTNTSNGAGDYFIAVWAPDGSIGHYKLTLQK